MKNFLLLILVIVGYAFGIYFYSRGFLLTRHTLGKNSSCTENRLTNVVDHENSSDSRLNLSNNKSPSICWMKPKYRRAIWIVIDALRFDFMAPIVENDHINEYYHNKFTIVHDLLKRRPRNCLLYKFLADAPTTTLQRLKGLTTGSLPTFVDAGSNFGGTEIDEDNLIDQLIRRRKNITFLGDDTWMTLFPHQFQRSFPFPSFDVKDLHTVDNGILEHLFHELNGNETTWQFFIAHFLGVDHCGHKYGPNHPEMALKLEQMNRIIKNIIESMDSETILFILGDHGMTQSGDHGGDSVDEISSALFVYSPIEIHREEMNIKDGVNQIDLVPTMSLLLDIPIPYSNLGKVLLELFPDQRSRSQAVEANVLQVFHFTEMYLANFRDQLLADQLQPIFNTFYAQEPDELTVEKSLDYINRISRVFVECWAKFHVGWMALGMVTLFETFLWLISFLIDRSSMFSGRLLMVKTGSFLLSLWVVLARQEQVPPMLGILLGALIIWHLHTIVFSICQSSAENGSNKLISLSFTSNLAGFLLIAHGLSQFSNSFVVYENRLSHYFLATLFGILFWNTMRKSKTISYFKASMEKKKKNVGIIWKFIQNLETKFGWKSIIYFFGTLILLRTTIWFGRCREEQAPCTSSVFTLAFASLLDENMKMFRFLLSICSLFLLYWLPRRFLTYNGHLSGDSILSIFVDFGHTLMTILITAYWILQWIPERYLNAHLFPPLILYATFISIMGIYFIWPTLTTIRMIENRNDLKLKQSINNLPNDGTLPEKEQVRRAYEHLKMNWRYYLKQDDGRESHEEEKRWAAFGLASGYSGPLVAIWTTWALLFALILGDGFTFPALVFEVVGLALMEISSENDSGDCLIFIITLCELSTHFFYSFGHQPTFATIPWEAAFIGVPGNFRFHVVQATMVVLRLSAAHVLVVFLIPLKACWRYYKRKLGPLAIRESTNEDELGTEAELIRRPDGFLSDLSYLNCAYLAAAAVKVLCSTVASTVHRRHLMVWKIFAPKFIFDSVHFLVTCVAIVIQYLFVMRLHKGLVKKFSGAEFVSQQKLK